MKYDTELPLIRNDNERMNRFIKQHKSFIASCVFKTTGRYVTESDDSFQVAMIAFYEAIEKYDGAKGGFLSFSSIVIRRRLIDDMEKEKKHSSEIPADLSEEWDDTGSVNDAFNASVRISQGMEASRVFERQQQTMDLKDEISGLSQVLYDYGFSFYELTKCSPVSRKSKQACSLVLSHMQSRPELICQMKRTKTLPIKELEAASGVKRKILERHRRYLIAVSEILTGEYELLREYIPQ